MLAMPCHSCYICLNRCFGGRGLSCTLFEEHKIHYLSILPLLIAYTVASSVLVLVHRTAYSHPCDTTLIFFDILHRDCGL